MNLNARLNALVVLGQQLNQENEQLVAVVKRTSLHNSWFTENNQWQAIAAIKQAFLTENALKSWLSAYNMPNTEGPPAISVGLTLAGNIPLVGFHDILSMFVAGHRAKVKLSDKDPYVIPFIVNILKNIDPDTAPYFDITNGFLKDFDAVIATGSNNSARYFEAYFGKYPHIIRKNRNAVAILRGDETTADFLNLGTDIFTYFGLGCRNVSKIYIPKNFSFDTFLETIHDAFKHIVLHDKYKNNFDYQFALTILNKIPYQSNGCILMIENTAIASPIAVLFYEYYSDMKALEAILSEKKDEIQCIISKNKVLDIPTFGFGEAQKPALDDYADGVDTLDFLLKLIQ
jgi:hypothetical protein